MSEYKDTYTITFGGQVENHVGMEKIGKISENGFTIKELELAKKEFECQNCECELIDLTENLPEKYNRKKYPAAILIIRNGVKLFTNPDKLYEEQSNLDWDKKAVQYKKVVNKHARWNLCFADFNQEPDYEISKGRVVNFEKLPFLSEIRNYLHSYLGEKADSLLAEGNYYYDLKRCYIGWHGDAERRIVIALRLGAPMSLHYQWHYKSDQIGSKIDLMLNHGDIYIMSEKATGQDWGKKIIPTLRHSAGCEKYLTFKKKPIKK
jgi:alkylated DNA repair dioxygenase AlkB